MFSVENLWLSFSFISRFPRLLLSFLSEEGIMGITEFFSSRQNAMIFRVTLLPG